LIGTANIVVNKGELFEPVLDMPGKFSNGFTVLDQQLLEKCPLFEKAYKIKT